MDRGYAELPAVSDRSAADNAPDGSALATQAVLPPSLRAGRWDPGRRGAAALALLAVLAAVGAGLFLLRSRPTELAAPPVSGAGVADVVGQPVRGGAAAGSDLVVAVAGKVRRPGLVHLPPGARVDDAVRAAGGSLPGATLGLLNLARKVVDGEQVLVGVDPPAGTANLAGSQAAGVDLNAADVGALDALPGIGPVLAQHIVDWRTEHGRFASIDQLREVSGIGEAKYASLKSKVRV